MMTWISRYLWLAATVFTLPALAYGEISPEVKKLLNSARSQVGRTIGYDGTYRVLSYPGGDVSQSTGVCTDVVIRAYRALGVDLQKLVHEDIKKNFDVYPSRRIWGLNGPDKNIDHRRVPNLRTFFRRHGTSLEGQENAQIEPGDLLTWELPGGLPHIGIVSDRVTAGGERRLIIHNIGRGVQEEDVIGKFRLTGRYRYAPWEYTR